MRSRLKSIYLSLILASILFSNGENASARPNLNDGYTIIASNSAGLILEFSSPEYLISRIELEGRVFERIDIPGAEYRSEAGRLRLPVQSALIALPPYADLELEILSDRTQEIPGNFPPIPALSPQPLVEDLQPGEWALPEIQNIAEPEGLYPEAPVRVGDTAWLRDLRIARIDFYPFQYDFQRKNYTWHSSLRVKVRFINNGVLPIGDFKDINKFPFLDESTLQRKLANYAQAGEWRTNPLAVNVEMRASPARTELPGSRYKIAVSQDGIYRMSYAELQAAGIPVESLDPTTFKMTNQGDEIGIIVENNDGNLHMFSASESIIFYGQKFTGENLAARYADENQHWFTYNTHYSDGTYGYWTPQLNAKMFEKYTDTNIYWLNYGDGIGMRMAEISGIPGSAPVVDRYIKTVHFEQNINWKTTTFTGEETWFGDLVTVNTINQMTARNYDVQLTSVLGGVYTATLRGEVVAITFNAAPEPDHHTLFYLNDPGRIQPIIDSTWSGKSRYHFEAQFPQNKLIEGQNRLEFMVRLFSSDQNVMLNDQIYFDWYEIDYQRALNAENNQLGFLIQQQGPVLVEMSNFSSNDVAILDVSNPLSPEMVSGYAYLGDEIRFQVENNSERHFHAGAIQDLSAAEIQAYTPSDLEGPADYVLVTHQDLLAGVAPLVNFRQSQGLATLVVDIEDLYNQFNDGIYHPIAIKNFLRYAFTNWDFPPTYVLLVGDGHWNLKGYSSYNSPQVYIPPNLVWVDPWQGEVDSANLLANVVGDDPLPDVHIARLPVNNLAELSSAINKIVQYEQNDLQDWQKRFLFIADNVPDSAGDFIAHSESIITSQIPAGFIVDRIYENDYGCPPTPCPQVNTAIVNTINSNGALVVNYTGHGSLNMWSGESIFVNADIGRLTNSNKLPIILSMTCLDGYWLHPGRGGNSSSSLVEELIRANAKGAVAAFSPTGLGVATGHEALHRGFYESMFQDGIWELGSAALAAKLELYSTGANLDLLHTFTIFGDPAMRIMPKFEAALPFVKK